VGNSLMTLVFSGLTQVTDITIASNTEISVSFPILEQADSINSTSNGFTRVDLSALKSATTVSAAVNEEMVELSFASLTTVDEDLSMSSNTGFPHLDFSALEQVGGAISISQLSITETIDLRNLKSAQSISLAATEKLKTIRLESLASAGKIYVAVNSLLESLEFTALSATTGDFGVYGNPMLSTLSIDALTTVGGSFEISGNNLLDCDPQAIEEQFDSQVETLICGNLPNSVCGEACPDLW
jgi:hypothetical protein